MFASSCPQLIRYKSAKRQDQDVKMGRVLLGNYVLAVIWFKAQKSGLHQDTFLDMSEICSVAHRHGETEVQSRWLRIEPGKGFYIESSRTW